MKRGLLSRSASCCYALCVLWLGLMGRADAQVTADFTSNTQSGCSPLTVQFIPQTTGAISSYQWDFGNGNTSTLPSPAVIYLNPGMYTVTLIVSDGVVQDTMIKTNYIKIFADPVADYEADVTAGCVPLSVQLTDSSIGLDAPIISYTWDFGDGSISTQANPSHVYNTPGTYDVTLVVVDSNGCSGTLFQSDLVSVGQPVNTNFSWTSVAGCQNPLEIAFTSNVNPSGSYTYQWDFGDGGTSTQQNPVHFYTNSGNYTVTLIATNANGCSDTLVRQDLIPFQFPTASFNLADTTACVGEMLAIANTSMGASSYLWDFGDGTTQSGQTPIHMYTTPGVYTLQLIASNALGCQDTFTFPQSILVQPSPVAAFTADDVDGCQTPHVVNFTAQTTNTVNWFWDFGDGNTANVANPTHVYNTTGFFDVQLIAESTNGCRDTINQPNFIQIIPPIASFLPDTVEGCTPLGVNFLDLSISSYDSITNWVWDFGDGTGTFAQNPSHTYTGQGLYTVSLTVVTSEGCRDTVSYSFIEAGLLPTVNFTANPLIVCAQDPVSFVDQSSAATEWEWFFGDGTGSILQNPVHAYGDTGTFDVMLVTTNFGCADTLLKPDFIKVLGPIADFVMNPEGGCQVPLTISFTDASIMATGWQWDFGDGSPQDTTQFPTHTYTTPGTYTVQLVVTNDTTTCVDSYSETFEIRTPVAGFTVNQTAGCTGLPVDFTNTSIDGTGYLWDFGDGNFSNQANPSHVYATPGSYDVTLIAQRNGGCADTLTLPNLIQIVGPKAVFLVDTVTGCAPLSVSFMDSSYVVPGTNNITGWFWDFGDGGVGTGPNPTHTYTQTGSYDVQLVIVDDQGCSDTLVKQSLIQPTFPNAAFTTNDTISCPGAPVSFINQSTGVGNTYLWNFGDGNTSTIPNPVHIYPPNIGTYSVVLTVTDANGCVSQTIASNFVEVGPPVANFFASPTQQSCPPLAVSFINQSSSNVTSWNWDFGDGSTSTLANPSKVYSLPGSFDVRLIVSTNQGCTDTLFAADLIDLTGPTGSFTMSNIAGCKPLTVDFAATTNGAVSWTWDFGDGSLGLGQNVSHTYFTDTTAFPVLLIEDSAGCTVAIPASDSVVVEPGPTANFISSESFTCTGKIVSFASTSTSNVPIVSYFWEFGDGDTSALANPTHIYATPGNYSVQLTVTNFDGCSDSLSVPVNITVNTPPQATFTPSQTQGCAPLTVNFGNSSTANGAIVGNFWDFGDGGNAVLSSPSYTFFTPGTYQVKLFVTDNNGCQDSTTEIITVLGSPLPNFIVSSDQGCAPKTVQFTDASVSNAGIQSWFWDFGDGNTGTGNQPQHTYVTNGSFDVSLTVTDANGCVATQVLPDLIELDAPDVSLTSDAVPSCPPLTVNFTGAAQSDTTIVQWEWLFGDGSSATTQNASYIYTQSGNFDVTLIVVDAKGCTDTLTEPQLVTIFDRPVADFAVSDSGICVPATISLTDTSTSAGVPIVSYTYDVSGGGQFNIPNPSIAFNTAGAYTIQQIIEDVNGCRDTATQNIDIYPSITANFSAVDTSGCVNAPITFIDQSGGASAPVSWNWFVDDSLFSSVQFPALAFDSVGSFDIGLIVGNSFGCEDSLTKPNFITLSGPEVAFLPDSAVGCRGTSINFSDITNADTTIVSWQWDFGDGNTATGPNPTHTYFQSGNYTVSLTITDANGCQQTLSRPNMVQIYQPPTAAFSMDQNSGCAPLAVQFTDASSGNGLNIISYAWDFDNGNTYNFPNGNQTFTQSGTYDIQLVVEDARGCLDTTTQVVTVNAGPQANFTADIFSGCSPRPIQFLSQAGGGTQVVNWNWDFGDGNTGSGALVSHTYQTDGIYDITLAVADANGCTDTLTVPQYINIGDPDLAFTVSENQTCPGAVLTFTDSSQVDTPLVNWIWDFGDGNTATGQQVSHTYTQPGSYDVILTGIDALGCVGRDTLTQGIEVRTPPVATMVLGDTAACPPFALQAVDSSQATGTFIVAWEWDMGNGQTSNFPNTIANYSTPGTYDIQLTVTDGFGCVDSTTEQIEVFGPPQANFISSETLACVGETISFVDVSQGNVVVDTWVWDFGDGATSLLQNPNHVYTQSGTYTVSLVIFDVRGCSDTLVQTDLIRVTQPSASFAVSGQPGCPGTSVSFQDGTVADTLLTSWFWDFGDGNTGTGNNPNHVYQDPGLYDVTLIVTNLIGCTDTLVLPNAVEIYQPPRANYNLSDSAGCAPLNVLASDTTESNSGITQWTWWLDGQFSAGGNAAQFLLENAGLYEINMQVTDANGCQDSLTRTIEVYANPIVDFLASDTVGCAGLVVLFADQSPGNINSWSWQFGDGNGATVQNPIHTYADDGLYDVTLSVVDDNGCTDTLTQSAYIELSRPQADFAVNYQPDCPPVLVSFAANASSGRGIAAYDWDFGDGNEGIGMETGHTYTDTGSYMVTLVVTDSLGCEAVVTKSSEVEIFGTEVPDQVELIAASVVNKEAVRLTWEKIAEADFSAYLLYWENESGNWELIHEVNAANDTIYIDSRPGVLDCENNSYCYRMVSRNFCGTEGSLNLAETHCTINLESQALPNRVVLNWNAYRGWDQVDQYEIYRVEGYDPANATFLDVVEGNTRTYIDSMTRCFNVYSYRILAVGLAQGQNAWSDTTGIRNLKTAPEQTAEILRATVEQNQSVLVEWKRWEVEDLIEVLIERSFDQGNTWQVLASLSPQATAYLDSSAAVESESYQYRLWARDSCGFVTPFTEIGTSILLEGVEAAGGNQLNWNPYLEWENGVDFYEIQVFNQSISEFVRVDVVEGNVTNYLDGQTFLDQPELCYRVIAYERGGNLQQSISSYACLGIKPVLYVPDAFTPNGDNVNENFLIKGQYIQQVDLKIFNRWGKLMYTADQLAPGWDGRTDGKPAPQGVYALTIIATATNGLKIRQEKMITLIR